ncbi:cell division protein ZapA [Tissierella sp. MSJ-40]|uniref:Cell division protein ZapA n=1 Tax=Tissierella simiarum TaxID=2841534 RepID=A0ABS6EBE5_9FIRM|nr:cell division protein ZapA [Tissierella simiarum]MBU5440240.1 cell division protein ZapA [Tissierella simiarum]
MTEKKKINVMIDGRNFTVVGSETEEYIRNLAYYVDEKIKNLTNKNDKLCQNMAAILAALNIADELYKTKSELNQLENQSKDPMEKYSSISSELQDSKNKVEELEKICSQYKDELLTSKLKNEDLTKEVDKYQQAMELKEKELIDSQGMIKKLQDKIFDNQIELIETKKELEEIIKLLDKEKNIFVKEEV